MNVEIGTEAAQFPEKKYINGISLALWHSMYNTTAPWYYLTPSLPAKRELRLSTCLHLWFNFGYLNTREAAVLSLLNEGHLDRMLGNLNKIIILS